MAEYAPPIIRYSQQSKKQPASGLQRTVRQICQCILPGAQTHFTVGGFLPEARLQQCVCAQAPVAANWHHMHCATLLRRRHQRHDHCQYLLPAPSLQHIRQADVMRSDAKQLLHMCLLALLGLEACCKPHARSSAWACHPLITATDTIVLPGVAVGSCCLPCLPPPAPPH